ncbi:serine protease [Streptomyces spiramenti]|uniref:Serine protease n=1 Tax=Streptomyces spiramenti TaxID=2720606 RepID=A0ABX1AVF2_9ACTN|nr:serine protease [Streptomyces spiramenti]NJP68247.1 serine protease [Streptomyces spiramenti]
MDEPRPDGPVLPALRDLAGRPRGRGFLADDQGTVITSHEAVDGLARVVVHPPGGTPWVVSATEITPLPEWNLALVRTPGLAGRAPLVVGSARAERRRHRLLLPLDVWTETAVIGAGPATYTATDRFHPLPRVLHLDVTESRGLRLRLNAELTGGPVLAVDTGAVVAVLGTALHSGEHGGAFAVPLAEAAEARPGGALAAVLERNAAVVPGHGADLNIAGALALCARTVPPHRHPPTGPGTGAIRRPEAAAELREFDTSDHTVLALVGAPGTGRSTVLAAHAAHRAGGEHRAPTVWLRGADLEADDRSVRDALRRVLGAADTEPRRADLRADLPTPREAGRTAPDPDVLARVARRAGRPLLVVLDAPEEMSTALAPDLTHWAAASAAWLRAAGARLAVACRPEFWEHAGPHFPTDSTHGGAETGAAAGIALPPCLWLGDLPPVQAAGVREALGIGSALDPAERRHPLSLRMLADVRAAQHGTGRGQGAPDRQQIFAAHLDLVSLRVAERLPSPTGGPALRRRAAQAQGRLHEAARGSLGPVVLPRTAFEALFPEPDGWAQAVLAAGVLVPAGAGFRFADEEFADWLQGRHLDLDTTLDTLLAAPDPGATGPAPPPIPRHRIGPVVFALLRLDHDLGADALRRRLSRLVVALAGREARAATASYPGGSGTPAHGASPAPCASSSNSQGPDRDAHWWCAHLLGETLLRLSDATGQLDTARRLATLVGEGRASAADFPAPFWRRMRLTTGDRIDLLRLVLPAGGPHRASAPPSGAPQTVAPLGRAPERNPYAATAAELLATDTGGAQRALCRWLDDERVLPVPAGPIGTGASAPSRTVADVARHLLTSRRTIDPGAFAEALVDAAHPHAHELLAELARREPAALCPVVSRWAEDPLPHRRAAAATHLGCLDGAPAGSEPTAREHLRRAARTLLRRTREPELHGPAYRLLVGDHATRTEYLPGALAHLAGGAHGRRGDRLLAAATAHAALSDPRGVLAAFRRQLRRSQADPVAVAVILGTLATIDTPALARPVAAVVAEFATLSAPHAAETVAAFVRARLDQGNGSRGTLTYLVERLARTAPRATRAIVARSLAEAGDPYAAYLGRLLVHPRQGPAVPPRARHGETAAPDSAGDATNASRRAATALPSPRPPDAPQAERLAAERGPGRPRSAGAPFAAPVDGVGTPFAHPADGPAGAADGPAQEGTGLPVHGSVPPHTGPRRVEAPGGRYF